MPIYDTPETTPTKQCGSCNELKPMTAQYFSRQKASRDGLSSQCKTCATAYQRVWRAANAERQKEKSRAYYLANKEWHNAQSRARYHANKESYKERSHAYRKARRQHFREYDRTRREKRKAYLVEYQRHYHAANREQHIERSRAYYQANKRVFAEKYRAWRIANKESFTANVRTRKARKRNAEGRHTGADIKRQYKAQKGKCYYCGMKVGENYHVDHVVPLSRGGSNWPENIVIACPTCNTSKQDKMPHEWPQGGRLL